MDQLTRGGDISEQANKGEGKKEDVPQWKPVGRTDEAKPEDVGQHEREQEVRDLFILGSLWLVLSETEWHVGTEEVVAFRARLNVAVTNLQYLKGL